MEPTTEKLLQNEINRVRDLATIYESMPAGPGKIAAYFMRDSIQLAEKSIFENDGRQMIIMLKKLHEYED